jgi:tocopherol cyclase
MTNRLMQLRALWQPEMYHGWGVQKQYFEGWYLKCVTSDEKYAISFIPGISMDVEGNQFAFVQVMFGTEGRSAFHRYAMADFEPSEFRFDVKIGENRFSGEKIDLNLPGIKGVLSFSGNIEWPKMLGAPGIMGWFSYVPFMECFHGIVSMNHQINGVLEIDGQSVDFTNGKGYIEKDWGRSFPKAYVWMQSNHFGDAGASLIASVAHIPFLGSHFIGFISGFWLEGKLFRFATYTGARKKLTILENHIELSFTNPKTAIHIRAHRAPGTALISPLSGAMTGKINESLQARIDVELTQNGKRIFEGTGTTAGLEVCLPPDDAEGEVLTR